MNHSRSLRRSLGQPGQEPNDVLAAAAAYHVAGGPVIVETLGVGIVP